MVKLLYIDKNQIFSLFLTQNQIKVSEASILNVLTLDNDRHKDFLKPWKKSENVQLINNKTRSKCERVGNGFKVSKKILAK